MVRSDVIRMYKDVHGWVGIISGLALFIAFYAGAITMFEGPLQRWASPPPSLTAAPSLQDTPKLVEKVLAAYPEAAKSYNIHMETGPEIPARLSWTTGSRSEPGPTFYASLDASGELEVNQESPSQVAEFIDILHQQVGLPFDHEIAMPIMGTIALLYAVALISGVICLLPSLVKDLFALRFGKNVKRMWLDLHNVLGLFSLPFHIIMALTSVVFAFHDQFYDVQDYVRDMGPPQVVSAEHHPAIQPSGPLLTPVQIKEHVARNIPGFTLQTLTYHQDESGSIGLDIMGTDPRHILRGATFGLGELNPYTGEVIEADYLPGLQDGWFSTVTSFFALHFGNYGGAPVRWSYFFLGLAGAFLFYSGNLLWIESRRKKERKSGPVEQSRSTRILAALTVGVPTGCVAGISATIAAAKLLPDAASWHAIIYYAIFLLMTGWAMIRGAAKSSSQLLYCAAFAMALIPLASLLSSAFAPIGWNHSGSTMLVDLVALAGSFCLALMALASRKRSQQKPHDSVWFYRKAAHAAGESY